MNFQEKVFEAAAKRVEGLQGSLEALTIVGHEFNKIARRHAVRFVKQNSVIAAEAGKDVSALARSTFATLSKSDMTRKPRKPATARKRATRKAA